MMYPSLISAVRGLEKYSVITKCGYYNSKAFYSLSTQLNDGTYLNIAAVDHETVDKLNESRLILERSPYAEFYSSKTDDNLNNLINPYKPGNFDFIGPHILPKSGQELTNSEEIIKYWYDNLEGVIELRKNLIAYLIKNWKQPLFECKFDNNVTYLNKSEEYDTLESFYTANKHLFNKEMKCIFDNIKMFDENNPGMLNSAQYSEIINHIIFKESFEENLITKLVNLIDTKVDPLNKETDGDGLANILLNFFNDLIN